MNRVSPTFIPALVVMFAGPLLQGLSGASDPNAYLFAPVIAVASLPIGARQDLQASLRLAAMFFAIGALALALWWVGGRIGPLGGIPGWLPLAVTAAGAILAVTPGFLRR
ncbi:hypothetical protein [Paracoccus marinus]|uniref:hypothetical protein n=1 Tax=Paracoccus marinus TaxID=288426 RepID=UPI00103FBFEC|nr:hypothetical protein [Paracoccus marinus]GLS80805.1 hypothetical protein GCM10007893_15960 [Paracoccus marinus]